MSSTKTRSRGRPRAVNKLTTVSVRVAASVVGVADEIAADLDRLSVPGLRHTRGDVMRAALGRGIEAMRADVDARLTSARG